ncbi:ion transporter [Deinococcus ficus]|uniref:Ion transport domain-containing protein n=1 Tax=Deinococcus ficus TaxID=317577 RepID=A0A221T1A9_9DEIO|nr:ion transporter [Deinococcus ficus]ASN82677.1 hypothetical protein DFI_16070 [Deinococcus ficus]
MTNPAPEPTDLHAARADLLQTLDDLLSGPLNVLGFVWLGLLVWELLGPVPAWVNLISNVIWGLFIVDFLLSFTLAPHKVTFLRRNWLSALSLLVPAVRFLRVFRGLRLLRTARLARGTRLFQILTRLNRGLKTLQRTLRRRQFGFVMLATLLVTLAGSAGLAYFEGTGGSAPGSYGAWVYWTGMLLMSLGPEHWPQSAEGRTLTALLGLYGFTVFGYITAALASVFVGADQSRLPEAEEVNNAALLAEVTALRQELARLSAAVPDPQED